MPKQKNHRLIHVEQFRVREGERARLDKRETDWLPDEVKDVPKHKLKAAATDRLEDVRDEMELLQDRLYAADSHSLLLIFQAMDAAGKDGTIRHVMSGVNPQGCQVYSFKVPSAEELDHDFMWRYNKALPERGRIGIFNRSHYEEVLVVRVHPELLAKQRIPGAKPTRAFWKQRYEQINDWERRLDRSGTRIVKFFLHVSKDEQRKRFLDRLEDPSKNWKFSAGDLAEREYWDDYQRAFEDAITATSTEHAPWYVVPADRKYVMRLVVAQIVLHTMRELDPQYPSILPEQRAVLEQARAQLEAESGGAGPG